MCTTTEMESELPNVIGQSLGPKDKVARLEFTNMIAQANIGSVQSQYIKTIISTFCESSISFCLRRATNDCFLYVHTDHLKIIKHLFNNYNTPQYAITVDASPYSFCAEVISVRMVDDEK